MRSRETPRPWTTTKAPSFLAPSFAFLEKNTSCFHMTLTDDIWTNREMLSSLDVFAEWSRITLTHITADWRLQRNQTLQTSWRNYTHHPPKAECLCIFKNLEAKKILHIELSRRRCCCARKRGTLNGGYAHATSASFGPQRRDRATKQRAGNRHVNKKKTHTHTRARSYSKYTHKVGTYQVVYSQRLWAQDVYQLPPDSCVGWPAVNCVSDSPLLLLIVSISVPAEKWGCCGQTQSYWSLWLVPDLPAARRGRDGRKKKEKGAGWSLHDTPRLSVCHLEGETGGVRGSFRSFRSLLCILKWFNYGRLCIWTATTVFFFPSSSKDTRSCRLFVDSGGRLGPSILGVDCIMVLCLCLRSAPPCSGRE